jgi:hypothetical protein
VQRPPSPQFHRRIAVIELEDADSCRPRSVLPARSGPLRSAAMELAKAPMASRSDAVDGSSTERLHVLDNDRRSFPYLPNSGLRSMHAICS